MTDNPTRTLVLFGQVENSYDTWTVKFRPGYRDDKGFMITPSWSRYHISDNIPRPELAGFTISAYLGHSNFSSQLDNEAGLWGVGHFYEDLSRIEDADYAKGIAKTLTKVKVGLEKMNNEVGWLGRDDFHGYVMRIAKILGIKGFAARSIRGKTWEFSGETYRDMTGASLQYWLNDIASVTRNGQRSGLIHR